MKPITKALIYNAVLFLIVWVITSLTESNYDINKWSIFGVIFFCFNYTLWSIALTFKIFMEDERTK